MPEADGSAPPFVIRELSGDEREVRLVGRALPYRPFELKTKQRVEVDWYPGMPIGTATVLGATEDPTELHGEWKDKFLGVADSGSTAPMSLDGSPVTTIKEAVRLFDSLCRLGQLIEVTWDDQTRHGHLSAFEKRFKNVHDVEWALTFDWVSRGESLGAASFGTSTVLSDTHGLLITQLDDLDRIGVPGGFGLSLGFVAGIQGIQHSIENLIQNVEDTIQGVVTQAQTAVRAARGIIATLTGIEAECGVMRDFLESSVAGAINGDVPVPSQGFSERLSAEEYRSELKLWAAAMRRIAVEQRTALDGQIVTDILASYVARLGEDLRDVSQLFYKTPFEWRRIMVFNDLTSAELSAGQLVQVPKLNPAEAGQGAPGI